MKTGLDFMHMRRFFSDVYLDRDEERCRFAFREKRVFAL